MNPYRSLRAMIANSVIQGDLKHLQAKLQHCVLPGEFDDLLDEINSARHRLPGSHPLAGEYAALHAQAYRRRQELIDDAVMADGSPLWSKP